MIYFILLFLFRQKAMKRLRVPPLGDKQSPWTTFKVQQTSVSNVFSRGLCFGSEFSRDLCVGSEFSRDLCVGSEFSRDLCVSEFCLISVFCDINAAKLETKRGIIKAILGE